MGGELARRGLGDSSERLSVFINVPPFPFSLSPFASKESGEVVEGEAVIGGSGRIVGEVFDEGGGGVGGGGDRIHAVPVDGSEELTNGEMETQGFAGRGFGGLLFEFLDFGGGVVPINAAEELADSLVGVDRRSGRL